MSWGELALRAERAYETLAIVALSLGANLVTGVEKASQPGAWRGLSSGFCLLVSGVCFLSAKWMVRRFAQALDFPEAVEAIEKSGRTKSRLAIAAGGGSFLGVVGIGLQIWRIVT